MLEAARDVYLAPLCVWQMEMYFGEMVNGTMGQ